MDGCKKEGGCQRAHLRATLSVLVYHLLICRPLNPLAVDVCCTVERGDVDGICWYRFSNVFHSDVR